MPERDGYIPGVPCWVDASHPEPEAALDFYRGLFGWELEDVMPDGSEARYFIGRIRAVMWRRWPPFPRARRPMPRWNTYIWVASADETAAKVRDAGGSVVAEPFDVLDSGRMAVAHRSRGSCVLRVAGEGSQGREVVNEHGALNFNGLATRDAEAAKAFYGAVFGWTLLACLAAPCGRCRATAIISRRAVPAFAR